MIIRSEIPNSNTKSSYVTSLIDPLNFATFVDHTKNSSILGGACKHNLGPRGREFERANIQEFKCPKDCSRGMLKLRIDQCIRSVHPK